MKLSVIIPTLNEEAALPRTLEALAVEREAGGCEILVADGGSTDRTRDHLPPGVGWLDVGAGRGRQLNAGARLATGEGLLFVHADCRLPPRALEAVESALADSRVAGGAFHKRFDSRHPLLRRARIRTRAWFALGAVFGDQAMFVRRDAFRAVGGFREDLLAEDLDLAWRLRRHGRLVLLPDEVTVSARRLERAGVLRTWARWWWIAARQAAGCGPRQGARLYPDVR